ncbi:MAG TPA: hypothetical protein VL127_06515 [Bryobacteraceae bacterium]|jgi:hypothetical protein|nr:hypothetical protein [Bryobacteraceae bacterium]
MRYANLKEPIDDIDRAIQGNPALSKCAAELPYFPLEGWKGHLAQFRGEAVEIKMSLSQEVLKFNP